MKRWYYIFRLLGYAGGLGGAVLLVLARQGRGASPGWMQAGGLLVIGGFTCFVVSYALYLAIRVTRSGRRRPPTPAAETPGNRH